jgi:hypothetical protein
MGISRNIGIGSGNPVLFSLHARTALSNPLTAGAAAPENSKTQFLQDELFRLF